MKKRITMEDVANLAKVSKSTVSQYINKRFDYMSEETKMRIQDAIEQLQYQPNVLARSLKQKKTSTIGVIIANILHTFSTQVIRAIEDACHQKDYHVIVCNSDDNPEKEKKYIEMLRAKQVDGLIIFPTGENVEVFQAISKEEYPIVFIDRYVPSLNLDAILLNNLSASLLAVEHFKEKGYTKIGFITNMLNRTPRIERMEGFKKALNKSGLPIIEDYIIGVESNELKKEVNRILSLPNPPQALLASNDTVLMEILKYSKENKIKIPKDLAVIGIDNVAFADFYNPPLTTINQPAFEMGHKAVNILFKKIENNNKDYESQVYRFEPEIIIRESC